MSGTIEAMGIDPGIMIILLLVLEVVLLIVVLSSTMKVRRMNARYNSFMTATAVLY